jgi:uncharacterized protein (AIM24 family)
MQSTLAQFNETQSTDAFSLQNGKLLKVRLENAPIQAKRGAMVAYQGDVAFEAASAGIGRLLKRATTGEGASLMELTGHGEVFLADRAQDIHLIKLESETITVNAANLLAFEAAIEWDVTRVAGVAGMLGGGLFNTVLRGSGFVAVVSDGPPVLLDVDRAPTFADAQAAITWSEDVTTSVRTDVKLKSALRGGSGESIQIAFGGHGWVLVQPSEGRVEGEGAGGSSGGGGLSGLLSG